MLGLQLELRQQRLCDKKKSHQESSEEDAMVKAFLVEGSREAMERAVDVVNYLRNGHDQAQVLFMLGPQNKKEEEIFYWEIEERNLLWKIVYLLERSNEDFYTEDNLTDNHPRKLYWRDCFYFMDTIFREESLVGSAPRVLREEKKREEQWQEEQERKKRRDEEEKKEQARRKERERRRKKKEQQKKQD